MSERQEADFTGRRLAASLVRWSREQVADRFRLDLLEQARARQEADRQRVAGEWGGVKEILEGVGAFEGPATTEVVWARVH